MYSELTHAGFHLYEEIFQLLAPVRKMYPKIKLPATASRKRHREEHERMAKLNQTEAERLTVLLEEKGTVNKVRHFLTLSTFVLNADSDLIFIRSWLTRG